MLIAYGVKTSDKWVKAVVWSLWWCFFVAAAIPCANFDIKSWEFNWEGWGWSTLAAGSEGLSY